MLEFDKLVLAKYSFEVKNILPFRDGYILATSEGRKFLKRVIQPEGRILFIHGAKEHLYKNNFKNIDRYVCTMEGNPFVKNDTEMYTVCDFVEGIECNFDSRNDIAGASRLLAQMHKASKGYESPSDNIARSDLGRLPQYFTKRLDEIKKLKKVAKRGKTKFDYLFLEHVDYFFKIGEHAIEQISGKTYEEVVEEVRKEKSFCHHDYTHHNLMLRDGKMYALNFDFCCYELKTYDVANLLRRKMRKCNWDVNEAKFIIDQYMRVEPLSEKDIFVLKVMLQFPQKLWRVVNKYYNSKRSWSEKSYISKLQEVVDEIEYHREFMNKFDSIL
ncbi:MAG: CotS family spore coat protein [Clostridia bacterium]|nr:CotS family spore coat protein [Clostridia bacterium]